MKKIIEAEQKADEIIDEMIEKQEEIRQVINAVEDSRYRTLLKYKYMNGYTFENIACKLYYSERWVRRLHNEALEEIKETLEVPLNDVI